MARKPITVQAPLHGPFGQIQAWLQAGPAGAEHLLEEVAWSPVLSNQSFEPGEGELRELYSTGAWISWLGGPAAAPLGRWPRRVDGAALAHVVTLDLADLDGVLDAQGKAVWPGLREGLPVTGVLEVFHDLQSFGHEAEDGESGAWLVRWVPDPDRGALVEPPDDLNYPSPACQPIMAFPGFTLPPAADKAGGPLEESGAAEALEEALRRAWLAQRFGSSDGYPIPVSHVYGHSQHGEINAREILRKVLPLTGPGDGHRLILDLESWTTLEGWFGDAGSLEVWMRGSDLATGRFENAWCLIRTD